MDATAWTVVAAAIAVLAAIGASFRSLREELRIRGRRIDARGEKVRRRIDARGEELSQRIDARGEELSQRIDARGEELSRRIDARGEELRQRIDARGKELRQRIDAWGKETGEQIGQLRERMAHLEGLLEGLREAIAGKRVA
jgi:uncharacterized protein RhaS with RHS repeats